MLERQADIRARSRACAKTGKRMAARMAMIAITTRASIRVNPGRPPRRRWFRDSADWGAMVAPPFFAEYLGPRADRLRPLDSRRRLLTDDFFLITAGSRNRGLHRDLLVTW